jgi:hypothetical protein
MRRTQRTCWMCLTATTSRRPHCRCVFVGQQVVCPYARLGVPEAAHGPTLQCHQLPCGSSTHSLYVLEVQERGTT